MWNATARAARRAADAATATRTPRLVRAGAACRGPAEVEPEATSSSAATSSRADGKRASGFFSRHRRTTRSSSGGTLRPEPDSPGGSCIRIAASVSAAESLRNARCPERSSYRRAPNEKTSLLASDGRPRACSGDMYPVVPRTVPGCVWPEEGETAVSSSVPVGSVRFARPKSRTLT